jgi:hypothetical protein
MTCSDCQLPLVAELPKWNAPEAFAVLWNGENAVFADQLFEQLKKAGIRAVRLPLDVLLRNSIDLYGLRRGPYYGFAVSVTVANFAAAKSVLQRLSKQEPDSFFVTPESAQLIGGTTEIPPDLPLHWDSATATVELWSGEDERLAKFIEDSLRGVGVPAHLLGDKKGFFRLMIRPEDETRGREIVRQIAESTAPEESQLSPLDTFWLEDPVESYRYLWLIAGIDLLLASLGVFASTPHYGTPSFIDLVGKLASLGMYIGWWWMLYQAIRYEIHPVRFILIAFLPFSFFWYYFERYAKRRGIHRLPIAVRMRMSPPPSA